MSDFANKTVFITGATSGLGHAAATLYAEAGAKVFAVGRNESALQALEQHYDTVKTAVLELADAEQCRASIQRCVEQFGGLDVLVNVAGKHRFQHSEAMTDSDWEQDLAVNLSAPFYLSQAAIPHLKKSQGNIVNVASIAGLTGQPYSAAYCAAKHGLLGMTKSMALEYVRSDIRINAICPGGMDTPQVQNISFPEDVDFELVMRSAGLRGMASAEEVASAILFMSSDAASAIHGTVLNVDNGRLID